MTLCPRNAGAIKTSCLSLVSSTIHVSYQVNISYLNSFISKMYRFNSFLKEMEKKVTGEKQFIYSETRFTYGTEIMVNESH